MENFSRYQHYSKSIFNRNALTIFLCVVVLVISCRGGQNLIANDHIDSIQIIQSLSNNKTISKTLTESNKIAEVVGEINQSITKPAYFKSQYILKVFYKNGKQRKVLSNGHFIMIDGKTYLANLKLDLLMR